MGMYRLTYPLDRDEGWRGIKVGQEWWGGEVIKSL